MLDFEKYWLERLSGKLEEVRGPDYRDSIMRSARNQTETSPPERIIGWTVSTMNRLEEDLSESDLHDVITGCACNYPPSRLEPMRAAFLRNRSFPEILSMLREQFRVTMKEGMMLEDQVIEDLFAMGMGPAGILEENRIVATKIPKSRNLRRWLAFGDPHGGRRLYCHCSRVAAAVELGMEVPASYCLCGAGYYRNMWEFITGESVVVEVLESVISGGDLCRIAIYPQALQA